MFLLFVCLLSQHEVGCHVTIQLSLSKTHIGQKQWGWVGGVSCHMREVQWGIRATLRIKKEQVSGKKLRFSEI